MNHVDYFVWLVSERTLHYLMWSWRLTLPLTLAVVLSALWAAWRVHPFPFGAVALQLSSVLPMLGILVLGAWFECRQCDVGAHRYATLAMHVLFISQGVGAIVLVWIGRRIRLLAGCSQLLLLWCGVWAWVAAREPGPFL